MEQRRVNKYLPRASTANDADEDAIELHHSTSGLQPGNDKNYYQDPYVQQQVDPLSKAEFGTTSQVGVIPVERQSSVSKVIGKHSR